MAYTNTPTWNEPTRAERAYSDAVELARDVAAVVQNEAQLCAKAVLMRMAARGIEVDADRLPPHEDARVTLASYLAEVIQDCFIVPTPEQAEDDAKYAGAPDGPEDD